jgi:DNA-binding response OmpR family regulator
MEISRLALLVVDDDPDDVELLRIRVKGIADWQVEVLSAPNSGVARATLAQRQVDVIVIDYQLGCATGLALLEELRAGGCDIPVIMATGHGNEEIAVAVMKAGADDYLVKSDLSAESLRRAISNANT